MQYFVILLPYPYYGKEFYLSHITDCVYNKSLSELHLNIIISWLYDAVILIAE